MKRDVIMYTMPLCPYCFRAKRYLSGKGISFVEKNIIVPQNFKELRGITKSIGVPVTVVGKRILTRFSLEEYEEVFGD